jgi:hypothetical protein
MYTVGNINIIAAVAVIGGGLFGFDISSMSAIIGIAICSGLRNSRTNH